MDQGPSLKPALILAALLSGSSAAAQDIDVELYGDLRLSFAKGEPGWLDGPWLGKGRYGGKLNGDTRSRLQLAELAAIVKIDLGGDFKTYLHLKYDPVQDDPVDIVEGFVTFKPAPSSAFSYEVRAGLFYPEISRENIGIAWTSPYTISSSAINNWVGEEIRALGLEAKATYRFDEVHKIEFTGAIFGFNDAAGTLLVQRGFAIGDVKTGAFGSLPLAATLPIFSTQFGPFPRSNPVVYPVREIDGRVGFYGALDYTYDDWLELGAFYYDNRGDPDEFGGGQYAWDTKFWNVYAEADLGSDFKVIGQFLIGSSVSGCLCGPTRVRVYDADFSSGFVLGTKAFGRYRFTARFDWFDVDDNSFQALDPNDEVGTSFTAAFVTKLAKKSSIIVEYNHINSLREARRLLGSATGEIFLPRQTNDILQISFRQRF